MRGDEPLRMAEEAGVDLDVPHMRGDEPPKISASQPAFFMYPTCVGMNRYAAAGHTYFGYVPHMRGDEPHEP